MNISSENPTNEIHDNIHASPETGDNVKPSEQSPKEVPADPSTKSDPVTEVNHQDTTTAEAGLSHQVQETSPKENQEEEETAGNLKDYSTFTKEQLIRELQSLVEKEDPRSITRPVTQLSEVFEVQAGADRKAALEKYLSGGGSEEDFKYKPDAEDKQYEALMNRYRTRRASYYADLEKQKETNLHKKQELLEKLRSLVDSEETTASIGALKKIQQEWKSIGPVPKHSIRSLWASYNALLDRYYDNRSIYFELKELDRKKNLESKLEICERAEKLTQNHNLLEAIRDLNELHEEFKHIGPVPADVQETIWQRFKTASDTIYQRRKEYLQGLKKNLNENLETKQHLITKIEELKNFSSESIGEWNKKTREILEIQKSWETVGPLPKDQAREINKRFWTGFKAFFNNKNRFFRLIEGKREENLALKEELIKKATELKDNDNFNETALKFKELQQQWKDIGPVPEKFKNEIFDRFKAVCDEFFDRRRNFGKQVEDEYNLNLERKEAICLELENMINNGNADMEKFNQLRSEFETVGFVPRDSIKKIQKRYSTLYEKFLGMVNIPEDQKVELRFENEMNKLKSSPNSDRMIQRKENEIRRQISKLESDIAIWKNNLEFFAISTKADQLKTEFNLKIDEASRQLAELKEELKMLSRI